MSDQRARRAVRRTDLYLRRVHVETVADLATIAAELGRVPSGLLNKVISDG